MLETVGVNRRLLRSPLRGMHPGMLVGGLCQLSGISDTEIASEERAVYLCVCTNSFVVALRASDRVLRIVRAFCEGRRNGGKENGG